MTAVRYQVRHRTEYRYGGEVSASYGRAHLTPRDAPGQRNLGTRIEAHPEPGHLSQRLDYFGNTCSYLEVLQPHTELSVTATSLVEVDREPAPLAALDRWTCRQAAELVAPRAEHGVAEPAARDAGPVAAEAEPFSTAAGPAAITDFLLPSPQVPNDPRLRAYAAGLLAPDRPLGTALAELVHRIHADFRYLPGVTSVTTTLAELLDRREGVCQDFAHLAVGCLRAAGLPARYVSGYLETQPPPGRPRLLGADASHAWVSVLVPELGWVDLDPTNDQPADARYIVTAWGRDYTDVPPLKGVIFTESGSSTLSVAVDVLRLPS